MDTQLLNHSKNQTTTCSGALFNFNWPDLPAPLTVVQESYVGELNHNRAQFISRSLYKSLLCKWQFVMQFWFCKWEIIREFGFCEWEFVRE